MHNTQFDIDLFAELYDAHPQAIVWLHPVWDAEHKEITDFAYAYSNEEGLNYLNISREQLEGLTVTNSPTLTDDLRHRFLNEMLNIYQTGEKAEYSFYNAALNKYARVLRTKIRGGILSVVQDTTHENRIIYQLEEQTKQLEEQSRQLEEQKTLMDNILKNSSNGISVSQVFRDENGIVIDALTILANDAAVNYIGFPREVYLTKRATEIEPAVMQSDYYKHCIKTLETGEPFFTQYFMESTHRWLELTVSRLDYNHLIQIFTDVTPIKEAQLRLEQTVEELKRSNTHLENFAHAASHDMKEPLRKIRTFTDRLKHSLVERLDTTEKGLMERIESAADRMQLLVDDLLEFSYVSQKPHQLEAVDLNEKIQKVLTDLELLIDEKEASITVGPLPTIHGNRRQLQQLFQNLISNALKYSQPGIAPVIAVHSTTVMGADIEKSFPGKQPDRLYHLIEVKDNGIGFEPEYAEQIFEMFKRLHGRMEYSGTGVGLSIARTVVQNHSGHIWASSQLGTGATFSIVFPAD